MTAITITDPAVIEQLRRADAIELRDPSGRVLGRFLVEAGVEPEGVEGVFLPPPGFVSPFTDEQRREFRKQVSGRPLKDILRDLEKRA